MLEGDRRFVELAYLFIVGSSLAFLFVVLVYALKNRSVAGSKAFLLQIICVTIWSVGSLLEMLSASEQSMLLWRNIEQIGIFLLPVAFVYFSLDYAHYDKLKKYLPFLLIISVTAIVLIFTDSKTHIMRNGYIISYSPLFGKALSVSQTTTGKVLVAYNYLLALISLVILFVFSRQVNRSMRRQVMLTFLATGLVFFLSFLKAAFLEGTSINIPIVTIYLPGGLILFYNLYRNDFFRVSPIARDKIFDVIEMGIIVTDRSGMIADINPSATQILQSCFSVDTKLSGKKMEEMFATYPEWIEMTKTFSAGEIELKLENDRLCYIHILVYPLQSNRGVSIGSVTIMRDVTVLRMQEFALKAKAETDSLTGLMNRDSFMAAFQQKLKDAAQNGEHISVLMMDLDKFKDINDTCGHNSGDRVLQAFAEVLKTVLRHEDAIARFGGDEFVAILPGVAKKEANEIAGRILNAVNRKVVVLENGTEIQLRLSIGICDNETITSEETMLKFADRAMYAAKNNSGNRSMTCE